MHPVLSNPVEYQVWDALNCRFRFHLDSLNCDLAIESETSSSLTRISCFQMWSYCQWTALRPAAGWTISCGRTRSSGRRTTAPSASVWTASRTARPWPASRAARTPSRSPASAVLFAKVLKEALMSNPKGLSSESWAHVHTWGTHIPHVGGSCVPTEAVPAWAH